MSKITFTDTLDFKNDATGNIPLSVGEDGADILMVNGRRLFMQDTEPSNPSDGDFWIKG